MSDIYPQIVHFANANLERHDMVAWQYDKTSI